jgi:hypothetical protein
MTMMNGLGHLESAMPLKPDLLEKYNFFELYPHDGGGAHIHYEIVGSVDDFEIAHAITKGNRLGEWGNLPNLDFGKLERWRSIERSCWINRFYFIASLSRYCWKSGDRQTAELVKNTILHFIRNFPAPKGLVEIERHVRYVYHIRDDEYNRRTCEENFRDETDVQYVWFDFQPASRVLHILYGLNFLRDFGIFVSEEIEEINKSLYEHAELICTEEIHFLPLLKGDNHQSLRGLVLLCAGAYFKGYGRWQEFLCEGCRICSFHINEDFHQDGVLAEHSPSYHCFETWHMRDAMLLSNRLGLELAVTDIDTRIDRAIAFIDAMRMPDRCSLVINDGYSLRLDGFLDAMADCRKTRNEQKLAFFADTGIGAYKSERHEVVFDCSSFTGRDSHYHAGKNAVTYWVNGLPLLVDSGCCSYDDPMFGNWYKYSQAHSSLLIDEKGDGDLIGTYNWRKHCQVSCNGWREDREGQMISSTLMSEVETWKDVRWTRTLKISDQEELNIVDLVENADGKNLCFVFNLHPDVVASRGERGIILQNRKAKTVMKFSCIKDINSDIIFDKGTCFVDFKHRPSTRVLVKTTGASHFIMETHFQESIAG